MIIALALALLTFAKPAACDLTTDRISSRAVGPLQVGESVNTLRRRCTTIRDTVVATRLIDSPDSLTPALVATVKGGPVIIYVQDGRVVSLAVMHAGPKTSDDIGVGTSIRRFRRVKGVELLQDDHHSGAGPMQIDDRCGMGFFLSAWGPVQALNDEGVIRVRNEFDRWPDSIHVTSVVVFGCGK